MGSGDVAAVEASSRRSLLSVSLEASSRRSAVLAKMGRDWRLQNRTRTAYKTRPPGRTHAGQRNIFIRPKSSGHPSLVNIFFELPIGPGKHRHCWGDIERCLDVGCSPDKSRGSKN